MVRVAGYHDRGGIQQALDLGADGVLVPYINSADEARQAVSCCRYPTEGTRSVYFPQRSTNKAGLLGYVGNANKNIIVALQVETASCIEHIDEIAAVHRVPISDLVDPANRCMVRHPSGYVGPGFLVAGMLVWGFTGALLDRLLDAFGWAQPWDRSRTVPLNPGPVPGE